MPTVSEKLREHREHNDRHSAKNNLVKVVKRMTSNGDMPFWAHLPPTNDVQRLLGNKNLADNMNFQMKVSDLAHNTNQNNFYLAPVTHLLSRQVCNMELCIAGLAHGTAIFLRAVPR